MQKKNKKGFTIVELVVVIAVIGILSAILIPTFMGLSENARKQAIQSDLSSIYTQYAVEAADGEIELEAVKTKATTQPAAAMVSEEKAFPVKILGQKEVLIDYKDAYYTFTDKNMWEIVENPVLRSIVLGSNDTPLDLTNGFGETEVGMPLAYPTFAGYAVYYK